MNTNFNNVFQPNKNIDSLICASRTPLEKKVYLTRNLVAFWAFSEEQGQDKVSSINNPLFLKEVNGFGIRVNEGPISGYSCKLSNLAYLSIPSNKVNQLNIYGENQGVSILAWLKWENKKGTGFICGMWDEGTDNGRRQYGLFLNLPYYNGANQVCGHISKTGKSSPPFPYSIDFSASKQIISLGGEWCFVAITYDGKLIKSYYNGVYEKREPELIKNTNGFPGYEHGLIQSKNPYYFPLGIGNNGSDFTVGATQLKSSMGNFFTGQIGGIAIFNTALKDNEIYNLIL